MNLSNILSKMLTFCHICHISVDHTPGDSNAITATDDSNFQCLDPNCWLQRHRSAETEEEKEQIRDAFDEAEATREERIARLRAANAPRDLDEMRQVVERRRDILLEARRELTEEQDPRVTALLAERAELIGRRAARLAREGNQQPESDDDGNEGEDEGEGQDRHGGHHNRRAPPPRRGGGNCSGESCPVRRPAESDESESESEDEHQVQQGPPIRRGGCGAPSCRYRSRGAPFFQSSSSQSRSNGRPDRQFEMMNGFEPMFSQSRRSGGGGGGRMGNMSMGSSNGGQTFEWSVNLGD